MARRSVSAAVRTGAWIQMGSSLPKRRQMGWELTQRWISDASDSLPTMRYWSM